MTSKEQIRKNAEFLSEVLQDPTGIATSMFKIYTSMRKAGFSEKRAMEITQWFTAMIIGTGGMLNEP